MLRKIISIGLLVSLVGSNFSSLFVYVGFVLNQKYITENLCVNRNRPLVECNGKCYFTQRIKEVTKNEKKQARTDQKNNYQEALPVLNNALAFEFNEETTSKIIYPKTITPATIQRATSILQPPKVV